MKLREILDPRHIVLDLKGGTKREVLARLAAPIVETHPSLDHEKLVDVLVRREEISTTAIADGIAIPHGKMILGEEVIAGFGRSREGIDFASVDGNPTHLFFLLVSPESHPSLHLRWLAHLAVLLKDPGLRQALLDAATPEEVLAAIDQAEQAQRQRQSNTAT
ncbi:MAG: PTS sugar transporter subunit IIA [Candidatus Dadabacteria bacterium]|nr:MAG: PTS sugar transporter subunit IIA [Candidatus Dadabacteria bacterium]